MVGGGRLGCGIALHNLRITNKIDEHLSLASCGMFCLKIYCLCAHRHLPSKPRVMIWRMCRGNNIDEQRA